MVSLLVLSLALSAPVAAATQSGAVSSESVAPQPSTQVQLEEPAQSFDPIVIQPDSDICYKIRAYIFSKGSNPRLIRETTCGPNRPSTRQIEGARPKLVPPDVKDESSELPRK